MAAARASRRESGRREVRNRDGLGGGAGGGGDSEAAAQEEGVNSVHVQWWEGVVGYRLARTRSCGCSRAWAAGEISCGLAAVCWRREKYLAAVWDVGPMVLPSFVSDPMNTEEEINFLKNPYKNNDQWHAMFYMKLQLLCGRVV